MTRGRWLTPADTGSTSCIGASNRRLSENLRPTSSLHSPTTLTPDTRPTARHRAVSGLLTLMRSAVGTVTFHGPCHLGHHGHAPQGAGDAAGPDGVADGLADAVTGRYLQVVTHALESAHRQGDDDDVSAVQCLAELGGGAHGQADAPYLGDVLGHVHHEREGGGVNVHQGHRDLLQRFGVGEIDEELWRPVGASASDDGDPGCSHAPER